MRRFKSGKTVDSLDELDVLIMRDHRWLILGDKPMHPGFIEGMTFKTLRQMIAGKRLKIAEEES